MLIFCFILPIFLPLCVFVCMSMHFVFGLYNKRGLHLALCIHVHCTVCEYLTYTYVYLCILLHCTMYIYMYNVHCTIKNIYRTYAPTLSTTKYVHGYHDCNDIVLTICLFTVCILQLHVGSSTT